MSKNNTKSAAKVAVSSGLTVGFLVAAYTFLAYADGFDVGRALRSEESGDLPADESEPKTDSTPESPEENGE